MSGISFYGQSPLSVISIRLKKYPTLSFIIHYSLFIIHYSLFVIRYSLFILHYSLFTLPPLTHSPILPLSHSPTLPFSHSPTHPVQPVQPIHLILLKSFAPAISRI